MNMRVFRPALGSLFVGIASVAALKADSTVAGLSTDFWAGFLLSLSVTLAVLAIAFLLQPRPRSAHGQ